MEKSIKQIKIIFWALLIIMLIMAAMAFYVTRQTGPLMDWTLSQKENLKSIILILALGGIPASYIFHSKKVKHIDPELPMAQKVNQFKISYLIKIITLEALSVLGSSQLHDYGGQYFSIYFCVTFCGLSDKQAHKKRNYRGD
ncbi:hypothetical protein [Marinilabilia salmonicolor]|uniref:hypothetical protein n=1 Tax=Marinilabilia salmonicolor TaxID=989 RepID=UPI001F243188|nr:hypothetical protein [Marinilabilia salmonicolor]